MRLSNVLSMSQAFIIGIVCVRAFHNDLILAIISEVLLIGLTVGYGIACENEIEGKSK